MMMKLAGGLTALVVSALVLVGCGDGSDPFADADPRCTAACAIGEPPLEGAFDICSRESAGECLEQCAARIEAVSPLCATCLTEGAQFGSADGDILDQWCETDGTCWIVSHDGEYCFYPRDDEPAREACVRQLYPRREVACTASWRPVTECAAICSGSAQEKDG